MFRPIVAAALIALSQTAHANPTGMSEADMQKMMQAAQEMQTCMQNVDQGAMERLGRESEAMQAEVKRLCAAGKRDAAQDHAMAFGMKAAKDPAMKTMAECGKKMQGIMPQARQMPYADVEEYKDRHVCDE